MNILFLTTHLNVGGITSYLYVLTKGLVKRGHKVTVVSSGGNMEKEFLSVGGTIVSLDVLTKSELSPKIYLAINPLKKIIRDYAIDLIHAQTRITQVLGQLVSLQCHVPYVSTCHGYFKNRFSRKIFPCWGERVFAISEAVEKHLKDDFCVGDGKIALVRSGIDLDRFPLISEETKVKVRNLYQLKDEPVIGIVARLSDVKGQDLLLSAVPLIKKEIPNIKVFLIGTGKLERVLTQMVEQLDLKDHVIFLPLVNDSAESLSLLDVFIAPSRQEGLGLSIMEAQASGLPVIASNVGGIPSLIEDGKTGFLFESENIEDLAQAIIAVLNHPHRRKDIGSAARQFACENYSSDIMIEQTVDVYKETILYNE